MESAIGFLVDLFDKEPKTRGLTIHITRVVGKSKAMWVCLILFLVIAQQVKILWRQPLQMLIIWTPFY